MIAEISRKDFLQMLTGEIYASGPWLAIHLFIPPEWLHELELPDPDKGLITGHVIGCGREILSVLGEGLFARVGWSSYFALARGDKAALELNLNDELVRLRLDEEYCRLWRYAVVELSDRTPQDTFAELEWQSYEKARQGGKESR